MSGQLDSTFGTLNPLEAQQLVKQLKPFGIEQFGSKELVLTTL